MLTASMSARFLRVLFWVVLNDTIAVTGAGVTSASLKAGVGDDLISVTGGITDGSLFGGTGNDASTSSAVESLALSIPDPVLTLLS